MNNFTIKQGQTLGLTITLSDPLEGDLYLGFYRQSNTKADIMLSTKDSLFPISDDKTKYSVTILPDVTKQLVPSVYSLEALHRVGDNIVQISTDKLIMNVESSNIGREIL